MEYDAPKERTLEARLEAGAEAKEEKSDNQLKQEELQHQGQKEQHQVWQKENRVLTIGIPGKRMN